MVPYKLISITHFPGEARKFVYQVIVVILVIGCKCHQSVEGHGSKWNVEMSTWTNEVRQAFEGIRWVVLNEQLIDILRLTGNLHTRGGRNMRM